MGVDIKAFIEVFPKLDIDLDVDLDMVEASSIQCFGEMFIERDTRLFGLIAGVGKEINPLVEPKGVPMVCSWRVRYAYTINTVDDDKWSLGHGESSYPKYCKRSQGEQWIRNGESKYVNKRLSEIIDPDAHTFSWLNVQELEQASDEYKALEQHSCYSLDSLNAIITLMKTLDNGQVGRTRLIFWFIGGKPGEQVMVDNIVGQLTHSQIVSVPMNN